MQYTYHDKHNNQTPTHSNTPLGTLTHKTPPQHTLAGNSWTTIDLRVMSIVLRLLDTPSYAWNWRALTDWRSPTRHPFLGIIHLKFCFRNIVRNTLLQLEDVVMACRKVPILTYFKNKFLNAQHAFLSNLHRPCSRSRGAVYCRKFCLLGPRTTTNIRVPHRVTCSLAHSASVRNKGPLSPNSRPIKKVRLITLLACEVKWFGHAL